MMQNSDENVALDNLRLKLWDNYLMKAHKKIFFHPSLDSYILWLFLICTTTICLFCYFRDNEIKFLVGAIIFIAIGVTIVWPRIFFFSFYFELNVNQGCYQINYFRNRCEYSDGKNYIVIKNGRYFIKNKDKVDADIYKLDRLLTKTINQIAISNKKIIFSTENNNFFSGGMYFDVSYIVTNLDSVPTSFFNRKSNGTIYLYNIDFFSNDTKEGVVYFPKLLLKAFEENGIEPPKDDRIVYIEGIDVRKYLEKK